MLLNDKQIKALGSNLIYPFTPVLISRDQGNPLLSYGVSSFGYDLRLSASQFKVFRHVPGQIVDPKHFNPSFLEDAPLNYDRYGKYFIMPAHSYALGVALEQLNVPPDITVLSVGKSTYARVGLIANVTPAEAGWKGHLTLEFSNSSNSDLKVYAEEGIIQLLFLKGEMCETSYNERSGKYQNQKEVVTYAVV